MKATKKDRKRPSDAARKSAGKLLTAGRRRRKGKDAALPDVAGAKHQPAAKMASASQKKPRDAEPQIERIKLVRDSFTMPREDFDLVAALKARALDFKRPTKKSELLRAGLQLLAAQDDAGLRASLEALRPLKAGRPSKKR